MSRGKQVGNFVIGERIGQGAFCNVYYCRERLSTSFDFAVKVVNKSKLRSSDMQDAFERELQSMKILKQSQNVVNLVAVLQSSRNYYLVMDLADAGTLLDRIVSAQRLSTPVARRYLRQLLHGLHAIHSSGVVHRDIKPENLLIDSRNILLISDFTFACLANEDRVLQRQCGTPHYVAPEVLGGQGYSGQKVDVWSAGVCLYVMLVGRLPFFAPELSVLYESIRIGKYEIPKTLPPTVVDLLSRMLCVDPQLRWDVPQLLTHPWVLGMEGSTYSRFASRRFASMLSSDSAGLTKSRSCPDMRTALGPREASKWCLNTRLQGTPVMRLTPLIQAPPSSMFQRLLNYLTLIPMLFRFMVLAGSLGFWAVIALFFDIRTLPGKLREWLIGVRGVAPQSRRRNTLPLGSVSPLKDE
eukprot:PhF_6_TR43681/c0_g1_i1/m.67133/K07198/PRKAA, AMPK; 5'-AMP-activated protein kinase, catalytic alpha subunit